MEVKIQINGEEKLIEQGLHSVHELLTIMKLGENRIFLSREDDIDIPLMSEEYLVIHGGEDFVAGSSDIENNPPLRNAITPEFNGNRKNSLKQAKILGKALKEWDEELPNGRLFVDVSGGVDVEIMDDMMIVVQETDSYFVIPSDENDIVDLEECSKHERRPPKCGKYRIRIDGKRYVIDSPDLTGAAILTLVGKDANSWFLNQKLHGGKRTRIKPEDTVDFAKPGVERFETVRKQAQQGND